VKRSRELIEQAAHIPDATQRQLVLAEAAGEILEGGRMATKQFDNIINLRDVARRTGSEGSKISGRLRTAVEVCKEHFRRQDRSDLQTSLEAVGYTLESMADELADTLIRIG
jgi:hypothetical protein